MGDLTIKITGRESLWHLTVEDEGEILIDRNFMFLEDVIEAVKRTVVILSTKGRTN